MITGHFLAGVITGLCLADVVGVLGRRFGRICYRAYRRFRKEDMEKSVVFTEEQDGHDYKLCGLPGHTHSIPVYFDICYSPGCWTWESRYSK